MVRGSSLFHPASAITDDDGQTEFTITALKKTGSARVKFKSGNVTTILKVKVVLTPLPTPTATPTPGVCKAKLITMSPKKLKLKKEESDDVVVTLAGKGGCQVADKTVKARITNGKGVHHCFAASAITNDEGQAVFTITALKKTSNSQVKFKSGNVTSILKVKVVLTPVPTPTATPTPGVCKARLITVSPRKLKLKKEESDDDGDVSPVKRLSGSRRDGKGKDYRGWGFITVSPASAITNDEGQAVFTITALKKTSNKGAV